jgi:YggT family protein
MNIIGALLFILQTIFTLYLSAVLLRIILQYVHAPFSHPICQFIVKITNFGFKPLRRVIPGYKGIDFAGIVFALIISSIYIALISLITVNTLPAIIFLLIASCFLIISTLLSVYFWTILLRVIFSFIPGNQLNYNPLYTLAYLITEPVLRPIRNNIPPVSGFDLSPLIACLIITVLRILFNI